MGIGRYHIIVDLVDVESEVLADAGALEDFLRYLPGVIDMKVLKGPEIVVGIPKNPGLTGFVIIDFSHISIHTFTNSKQACVDIFSCKAYERQEAIDAISNFFKVSKLQLKTKVVEWK
jgi:S-adenosylmethionine decarboxylase